MALPSIEVEVTADTLQAEAGLDRVGDKAVQMGGQLRRAQRSTASFQRGVQNAAFQVGDFAVQVGGGVDASRALAQQLPQLLGGFGVFGAVLGAVVAIAAPLATAMNNLNTEGRDMTEVFGTLQPLAQGIAEALRTASQMALSFAEVIVNNIDRILTIGATAAAFFAVKWVAGFVAARIATFSLASALVTLRGALIRTGIGALIVGVGELVFQFTRLVKAAGGFGEALGLLKGVAVEVFDRIKASFGIVPLAIKQGSAAMAQFFLEQLAKMGAAFVDFTHDVASGLNNIFGTSLMGVDARPFNEIRFLAKDMEETATSAGEAIGSILENVGAPLETITKIRDLLASMKEEGFTLDSILGLGDGEDDGGDKMQEKLDEQAKRIKEHFDRIKAISTGSLSDQLGGWSDYFDGLISLTGSRNEKLLRVAKAFKSAQALIDAWSAYNQVLADPSLPYFAKFAAGAQVLAAGIGAVNAIRGVNAGGGGAGAASAGGGAAAAAAPALPSQNVVIDLGGQDAIGTDSVRRLFEQLNSGIRDGYQLSGITVR